MKNGSSLRRAVACVALVAAALHGAPAGAGAPAASAPRTTPAPTGAAPVAAPRPCPDLAAVRVGSVERSGAASRSEPGGKPVVELREEIVLRVENLPTLLERAACPSGKRKVVLFLDGRPVPTSEPYPPVDPQHGQLKFQLERREESDSTRAVWTHLLGRPSFDPREVKVSVGLADEFEVASEATIRLRVIPREWFLTWSVLLVVLLICFGMLAAKSDVVRDAVDPTPGARKPYSLAKMQAAWWFFLILASYLFIGLVTGDYNTSITGTVLSLMGISAITAVGSSVIDAGKRETAAARAAAAAAAAAPAPPAAPAAPAAPAPPAAAPAPPTAPAKGVVTKGSWWLDIVSDESGVNFHRFQMAAWTAVLGIIFVHDVYVGLAMPEFDNTLLGLLGISSGTYLGLKTTSERRA